MKKDYKLLIFDIDGTLLDTSEGIVSSIKYALKKNGLFLPRGFDYKVFIGPPIQLSIASFFPFLKESDVKKVSLDFRNHYKRYDLFKAKPYANMFKVLDFAKEHNIRIAVASYKREDYAYEIVDHFGITSYTKSIFGQDCAGKLKKEDIIRLAIKESGFDASDCLVIGDTTSDGEASRIIGIDFLEVTFGFGFAKTNHFLGPSVGAVNDYLELLNFLITSISV